MGTLIAIEGIDGSGKSTHADLLASRLKARGLSVTQLRFPRYHETLCGRAVASYLNGHLGKSHPTLIAPLFALDRFESREHIRHSLASHDLLIIDRYIASNIAYQAAHLADPDEQQSLAAWINSLETSLLGLTPADITILLDLPASIAADLIRRKAPRSYTSHAADLYEADLAYQNRVRELYLGLAAKSPGWHTIPVTDGDSPRPLADIADQIAATLIRALPSRG